MDHLIKDEDGYVDEPCLSCEASYVEDIWFEWMCDEKHCIHQEEYEEALNKMSQD